MGLNGLTRNEKTREMNFFVKTFLYRWQVVMYLSSRKLVHQTA
jgi:hypothetical protein